MQVALDRDALYYPYIHIPDVNWLKATLLCFPQVRRITPRPSDLLIYDPEEIRPFREVIGARGKPLLVEEYTGPAPAEESPAYRAQARLLAILDKHDQFIRERYSRTITLRDFPEDPDAFQIHTGKMQTELVHYLASRDLGWSPRITRTTSGDTQWVALHPELGEAVMSMIAIAIARDKGLDVVTSSGRVHHAIAALNEDEVIDGLLNRSGGEGTTPSAELVDELAEVVLTTRFDVSRLSATQIAELIKDGKDLRSFKTALIPIAQSLPDIRDPVEREQRLHEKADEVIESWMAYRKSLPRFAIEALVDATDVTAPDIATGLLAGSATGIAIASGWGIAIGLVTWKGIGIYRKFKERSSDPMRFLSRVEKAGAALVMSSPQA